jgi:hypothetical protein
MVTGVDSIVILAIQGISEPPQPISQGIYATNTQIAVWWGQTVTAQAENPQTTRVYGLSPTQNSQQVQIKQTESAIRATNVYIIEFTQKTQTAQAVTKTALPTVTPTLRQANVETTP